MAWTMVYRYGCWIAENSLGQQIWSRDEKQLRDLFEKAGYTLRPAVSDEKANG